MLVRRIALPQVLKITEIFRDLILSKSKTAWNIHTSSYFQRQKRSCSYCKLSRLSGWKFQPELDWPVDIQPEPRARSSKTGLSPIRLRAARPECRPLNKTILPSYLKRWFETFNTSFLNIQICFFGLTKNKHLRLGYFSMWPRSIQLRKIFSQKPQSLSPL